MKPHSHRLFLLFFATLFTAAAPGAHAQALYIVRKAQVFIQTGGTPSASGFSGAILAAPSGAYVFSAHAPAATTLTLPNGTTAQLSPRPGGREFELGQSFMTAAALDAAYPNGTYRMAGSGIPALSFGLQPDSYPASSPLVLQGGWTNNVLVVDPSRANTLSLAGNRGFATADIAARMSIEITGLSDGVELQNQIVSKAVLGFPPAATGFTSFTIPAGTLTAGRVYQGEIGWDVATMLDESTVPNAGVLALYSRVLRFYIVARAGEVTTPPPAVLDQPQDQLAALGGAATLNATVTVDGVEPHPGRFPTVVWFFNGQRLRIDGVKYSLDHGVGLTIHNLTTADAGRYYAHVMNSAGLVTTRAATLSVRDTAPPAFVRNPRGITIAEGSTAVFSVAVSANPAPRYQWRFNDRDVPPTLLGANGPTLVIPNVNGAHAGVYSVVVANTSGVQNSVLSSRASLRVVPAGEMTRLANLSILTSLAAAETMTLGTVLGGSNTTGSKALLARAAGPALTQLGVAGTLSDPTMTMNHTSATPSAQVAANDDWSGAADLSEAFAAVGAFPYGSATSKDAALFRPALPPGDYTIEVRPAAGSGLVIAELYDATPPAAFTATTPRLINVSALKSIATGGTLTAGFVITGPAAKTVLIRAIGPGLAAFGVSDLMPDPQLTLASTSDTPAVVLATNNDWNGDLAIAETASRVGAVALSDLTSKDAVVVTTLLPGNYTANVSPAAGTSGGRVLVEVYEVP